MGLSDGWLTRARIGGRKATSKGDERQYVAIWYGQSDLHREKHLVAGDLQVGPVFVKEIRGELS
jgi:hypothetical protein